MDRLIKAEELNVGDIVRRPNSTQRLYVSSADYGHLSFTPCTKKGALDMRHYVGWKGFYGGQEFVLEQRAMPSPE